MTRKTMEFTFRIYISFLNFMLRFYAKSRVKTSDPP